MTAFKNGQIIASSSDRKFMGVLRRDQGGDPYILVRSHDDRRREPWATVARLKLTPDAARALVA